MVRPKLLVIEDHDVTATHLKWALKDEFELVTASDPKAALTLARECSPSVILLDLGLPLNKVDSEGGFRFLREIIENSLHSKVIVYANDARQLAS